MQAQCVTRVRPIPKAWQFHFYSLINPLRPQKSNLFQTLTLEMVTHSGSAKRPMCPSCSKPTRLCLCTRLKTPRLHNSVAVTILQHSLEKKHPLNSTRIASIALENLSVIPVSDVNFQAEFSIRLLSSNPEMGVANLDESGGGCRDVMKQSDCSVDLKHSSEVMSDSKSEIFNGNGEKAVVFTVEKQGRIASFQDCWKVENGVARWDFDHLLGCREAVSNLGKGFVVKKLQRNIEFEEKEEFEIAVPAGSVLLFPSEKSGGVEGLDFEVKNLIVLDGTWAKARRMYNENPWLKLLPHLKLDMDRLSLYGEVRHQPKQGCLSTIESIVYALKAVGEEDLEGLDGLLDVFASMVGDQRRCKDERLNKPYSRNE
nr:DTW domain-containing protein [Ipomoea batatas]